MLIDVANSLIANLRRHDLIIRYGGDEFVCALAGVNLAQAEQRLALVSAALAQASEPGSITAGLALLQPSDTADDLIARADQALYQHRDEQRPHQPNPPT